MASEGLPQGKELEILGSVRDKVPAEVFTTPYRNPLGGTAEAQRANLRRAFELLREAGYEQRGGQGIFHKDRRTPEDLELLGFDRPSRAKRCLTNRRSSGSASA